MRVANATHRHIQSSIACGRSSRGRVENKRLLLIIQMGVIKNKIVCHCLSSSPGVALY